MFLEKNSKIKEDIAQECYDYMLTDAGRQRVLNPPERTPIADVNWGTIDFEKEIEVRVDLYVENYLNSDGVFKRYECIQREINTFCEQVISDLVLMEKEWIGTIPSILSFSPFNELVPPGALGYNPVWMGALAVGFGLHGAHIPFIVGSLWGWTTRKTDEEINHEYNKHMAKIRRDICDHLDENWGLVIIKLIDKVTEDVLPKRFQTYKTIIEQISENRDKNKANKNRLKFDAVKIWNMENTITKLTECLKS